MTTVRLPWLPKGYNPNGSQSNFYAKASAAKTYKRACAMECLAQGVKRLPGETAHVTVTFHPPTARKYDLDNALARCKQGLDAVAEAVGIDDADWLSMRLVRGDKIKGGAVVVEIEPELSKS